MENMGSTESLYFDPSTGKLCTSRPSNDKAIAVDMNKQGSGGFFGVNLGKTWNRERLYNSVLGDKFQQLCAGPRLMSYVNITEKHHL